MKKRSKIIIILAIILVSIIVFVKIYPPGILTHDTEMTIGKIVDFGKDYRSPTYFPKYQYVIKNITYNGRSSCPINVNYRDDFMGKYFPVVFSKKDTSVSTMLIEPEDFDFYKIQIPDSLNWVRDKIGW